MILNLTLNKLTHQLKGMQQNFISCSRFKINCNDQSRLRKYETYTFSMKISSMQELVHKRKQQHITYVIYELKEYERKKIILHEISALASLSDEIINLM